MRLPRTQISSAYCGSLLPSRLLSAALLAALASALPGCGGAGYGDFNRSLSGDVGNGYNGSISSQGRNHADGPTSGQGRGVFPKIETSFKLSNLPGDPFDYEKVNVQVTLRKPDNGTVDVPAFFDGDDTWRMRFTPTQPGTYAVVNVKLNREIAHEERLEKKDWNVNGETEPGFVRIDRGDKTRFVFDNGGRYYPLGQNQAWKNDKQPEIADIFVKMHDAGENWSRVWMTHFDGKNLDWSQQSSEKKADTKPADSKAAKFGDIDLAAAKKWDAILAGAEKNGIYLQMVLQHHGQYSTTVNPNWEQNPYNVKNGGFLSKPEEFFNNPQARALTKRKLYYTLARWGYSPNILAFELFNEVEFTNTGQNKQWDDIALWHREMALFLRQFDGYHHLLTTSSAPSIPLDNPIWETVDYVQTHTYPPDVLSALGGSETVLTRGQKLPTVPKSSKPQFIGEFGGSDLNDPSGNALHQGLWASMMRNGTGAAQYWSWDEVEKYDLYPHFKAASGFVTASGLASHGNLVNTTLTVDTSQKASLRFAPGGGFVKAIQSEFVVGKEGAPAGIDQYPAFLQGQIHREMTPQPLTFQVSYPQAGTFTLLVDKISKSGAHLKVSVDGKATERDYPADTAEYRPKAEQQTIQTDVAAGAHTITIENTGKDWAVLRQIALGNYAPSLAASARVGKDFAIAWVYQRDNIYAPKEKESALTPSTGKVLVTGLQPGKYRYTWWDTYAGRSLDSSEVSLGKTNDGIEIATPPVTRDIALYVTKAGVPNPRTKQDKGPAPMPSPTVPTPAGVTAARSGSAGTPNALQNGTH